MADDMPASSVAIRPFRFECTACGKCCLEQHGGATLYVSDAKRLAKFLEMSVAEFVKKYCTFKVHRGEGKSGPYAIADLRLRARGGKCVFLEGKLCSVHEAKPYQCKAAPFVTEIFADREAKELLMAICDGYGEGPMHSVEEIETWLRRELRHERADLRAYQKGAATTLGIAAVPGKR